MAKISPFSKESKLKAKRIQAEAEKYFDLYFEPDNKRSYTYNPLDTDPNRVYIPQGINYKQFLKDVKEYRASAYNEYSNKLLQQIYEATEQRRKYIASFGNNRQREALSKPLPKPTFLPVKITAEEMQKRYPNVGSPSEGEIARYAPNQVGYVQSETTPLVRSGADAASKLGTISARRPSRGRLSTIQGQATGLNPLY